jgi:hypothetical protein
VNKADRAEYARLRRQLVAEIELEIKDHAKWCGCDGYFFIPSAYREMRLAGSTAETVQGDYDSCHACR